MTLANDFLEALIDRTIDLTRLEADLVKMTQAEVGRMHRRLIRLIREGDPRIHSRALRVINDTFERVRTMQEAQQRRLITADLSYYDDALNKAANYTLVTTQASPELVDDILRASSVFGAADRDWWRRQSRRTKERFSDTVRRGLFLGRSNAAIARAWNDEAKIGLRQATAQVRTATNTVMNRTRDRFARENDDIIKGFTAVATLDMRTSATCRAYDGMAWSLEGKPITAGTTLPYPGPPPYHWNCRTAWVPVIKSFDELTNGRIKQELPPGLRASMDGQVPDNITYTDWFNAQPEERQLEILGPGKLSLYRKGKLSFTDMVDQTGNELTIDELEQKQKRSQG